MRNMIDLNKGFMDELCHIIYYEWYLDIRAGGPTGYLANLLDGLNQIENSNPKVFFNVQEKNIQNNTLEVQPLQKLAHKFFYSTDKLKSFYNNYLSKYQKQCYENYLNFLRNYSEMYCNGEMFSKINLNNTYTIHAHTVEDALKIKNTLRVNNNKTTKLMLTCHTPEATSNEYYKTVREEGYSKERANEIRKGWEVVERRAFESADILVFPSKEAMEPLETTMKDFSAIAKNKDIRFMATGAKKLTSSLTKDEAKRKYGVEDKFVIGYVGRHNEIKGYDILKEAAKKVLSVNDKVCFLIGGSQGNTFAPLQNKGWIEAGWVNPSDLFMALDAFVLPNRMTYFDLVLLEVMSMGIPVIASATGGNKSVQNMTDSLILYGNTTDELADSILSFYDKGASEREKISKKIANAYNEKFTTRVFAENYKKMIEEIYRDYDFYKD